MPHAPYLLRQIPPCRDALFLADAELGEDLREPPSFGVARFPRAAEHVDFVRLDFGRDGEAVLRLLRVGRLYFAPRSIDEFASAEAIAFPRLIRVRGQRRNTAGVGELLIDRAHDEI